MVKQSCESGQVAWIFEWPPRKILPVIAHVRQPRDPRMKTALGQSGLGIDDADTADNAEPFVVAGCDKGVISHLLRCRSGCRVRSENPEFLNAMRGRSASRYDDVAAAIDEPLGEHHDYEGGGDCGPHPVTAELHG